MENEEEHTPDGAKQEIFEREADKAFIVFLVSYIMRIENKKIETRSYSDRFIELYTEFNVTCKPLLDKLEAEYE